MTRSIVTANRGMSPLCYASRRSSRQGVAGPRMGVETSLTLFEPCSRALRMKSERRSRFTVEGLPHRKAGLPGRRGKGAK